MTTKHFNSVIFFFIFSLALFLSYSIVTKATSSEDITFPVAELGNCKSEADCEAYCDKPENIKPCVVFARDHNLISETEAEDAEKFADILETGGPGGCKTKDSCEAYCEGTVHIEECLDFAESRGLMPQEELEEAKKVAQALRDGAQLPGNCKNKKDCDVYCSEPSHMEECFEFAVKAGFVPPEEIEEARKAMPFILRGETPGGCKKKEECEAYCQQESHFEECVSFAEKAGFMTAEEAEMARKTGGKGPGGCNSKESCETFCNEPANQETCFNFAKEHGLISEEELQNIEEGMGRLRAGVQQAPPEVVSCLKENLGENIIDKIETGDLVPGPQIGDTVKNCFEQFMPQLREQLRESFEQAPPEVMECLRNSVGDEVIDGIKAGEAPDPEIGDQMRECFEARKEEIMKEGLERIREGLNQMTPEMKTCLQERVGSEVLAKIEAGEPVEIGPEFGDIMRQCVEQYMPQMPPTPPEEMSPPQIPEGGIIPPGVSGAVNCTLFSAVPNCSVIPDATGRAFCEQCKTGGQ